MKLSEWAKSQSRQAWLMAIAIVMLLVMIATRWGYTSRTAAEAFRQRFLPPAEQADSIAPATEAPVTESDTLRISPESKESVGK